VASVLGLLAVGCCGLFAGAALYINLVEHPARMSCGVETALREFVPSYNRAAVMQASLAVLGGAAGVLTWLVLGGRGYLIGGLLLLAIVPFTLLIVLPTNKLLLDLHARREVGNAEELLGRWNALHAIRTVLSVAAFAFMLSALL
jgi:hypothetical protein